jgi:hypothetical protein
MKLKTHLIVTLILTFLGAFIGFAIAAIIDEMGVLKEYPPLFYFAPAIFLGGVAPRFFMKRLFPPECPKCGGRLRFSGGRPVIYKCSECSFMQETKWEDGARDT